MDVPDSFIPFFSFLFSYICSFLGKTLMFEKNVEPNFRGLWLLYCYFQQEQYILSISYVLKYLISQSSVTCMSIPGSSGKAEIRYSDCSQRNLPGMS